MGRKKQLAKGQVSNLPELLLTNPAIMQKHQGQWQKLFNNNQPILLEVGSGKGVFLNTLANLNPDTNYIGLEIKEERILSATQKSKTNNLKNIIWLQTTIDLLPQIFFNNELSGLYINFPDPWPKKKHTKRRMTNPDYLKIYNSLLKPESLFQLKTDNQFFWHYSAFTIMQSKWKIIANIQNLPDDNDNIATEFEMKFRQKLLPIYQIIASPQ